MKKLILIFIVLFLFTSTSYPCFDTYLFLQKGSMVYKHKTLALEMIGEYSVNKISYPGEDMFLFNGNIYYGLVPHFSVQLSLGSSEKQRDNFNLDSYGIRGVYNVFTSLSNNYTLDLIAEHYVNLDEKEFTISLPNMFRSSELTYVIHPTLNYTMNAKKFIPGIHTGLFHIFSETGLIGIGAEYKSIQSSSYAGLRITQSEFATSLFFGAYIGKSLYIQNEFAKGLANSRDFGFAITLKFIN